MNLLVFTYDYIILKTNVFVTSDQMQKIQNTSKGENFSLPVVSSLIHSNCMARCMAPENIKKKHICKILIYI